MQSNTKPISNKHGCSIEFLTSKESSNMLRSTLFTSKTSANNLNCSVIHQDSLFTNNNELQDNTKFQDITDYEDQPQINIINKSNYEDNDNNISTNDAVIQELNEAAFRNGMIRDFLRSSKLETIRETNSEISYFKKDVVSVQNNNNNMSGGGSINNTSNNLLSMLDERNFFSKAATLIRNFNHSLSENISQDGNNELLTPTMTTFKEIEKLFSSKSSLSIFANNVSNNEIKSECYERKNEHNVHCDRNVKKSYTFNNTCRHNKNCNIYVST